MEFSQFSQDIRGTTYNVANYDTPMGLPYKLYVDTRIYARAIPYGILASRTESDAFTDADILTYLNTLQLKPPMVCVYQQGNRDGETFIYEVRESGKIVYKSQILPHRLPAKTTYNDPIYLDCSCFGAASQISCLLVDEAIIKMFDIFPKAFEQNSFCLSIHGAQALKHPYRIERTEDDGIEGYESYTLLHPTVGPMNCYALHILQLEKGDDGNDIIRVYEKQQGNVIFVTTIHPELLSFLHVAFESIQETQGIRSYFGEIIDEYLKKMDLPKSLLLDFLN